MLSITGRAPLIGMVGLLLVSCGGGESTPDGGVDAGADSGLDSGVGERRVFVTNSVQSANLGGVAGADALCVAQASEAELGGTFRAWLSTLTSSVADRLNRDGGPFVLVDGTVIATDWDDLVDGSITAPINLDADGTARGGDVWTGTVANGTSYPSDDCAGFTSGTAGIALCGATASTTATWTENITPSCGTQLRLYCIEE